MKNLDKKYIMVLLLTAGLNVWNIVYLPSYFYVPFQEAFGLTNEQQGTLLSMYGIMAVIAYFLGGPIADKFKPKTLMVASSFLTAALGLYMSTKPSYAILLVIYFIFGITATLLYWSAFVKSLKLMGDDSEQGKIFGAFESFYGLVSLVLSYVVLMALSSYIASNGNFEYVIYCYCGFSIVVAILIALFFDPDKYCVYTGAINEEKFEFKMIPQAFKLPVTWFNSIIVFLMFFIICGAIYIGPFVNTVYALPVTLATGISITIKYGFRMIFSPIGGRMVDKEGKSSMVLVKIAISIVVASVILVLVPKSPEYVILGIVAAFIFCVTFNLPRACMYVPVAEVKVDAKILGTVVGLVSAFGYSSDIWIWKMFGAILDSKGDQGYVYLFALMGVAAALLAITGFFYDKYLKSLSAEQK